MKGFQKGVERWLRECFNSTIAIEPLERNRRLLEEACELVQSLGMTREQALESVHDAFDKTPGEPKQEVGGLLVCTAALCSAHGIDMEEVMMTEYERIWNNMPLIREKQRLKAQKGLSMSMED